MNRDEHLAWCKKLALEYCDAGNTREAFASFTSDMSKHVDTANHSAIGLMAQLFFGGFLSDAAEMRRFIEGFN